ncbi:MAG TPA: protein kinase [Anaerolineae bacterium]|nr:protein kinase [Anaerolineae bacterium]HQK15446.1 protein kinase [Anaerolineae bacterium]
MTSVLFLIGKTLGKYQVLEHIGHGGMSEVYKGQHVQLDRMVAVKVLHPFLADEEGFVTRFKREASIVAKLRHPNIMQVYDFDYNEALDVYYMVMEYIDGPTLKTRLNEGPLPQEEAVRIAALIADALDYAHRRGMVHRDVKPANIMFMPDGQPVLTDFGIAKMLTLSGLTASGAMVGTPAYMAPEVGMGRPGSASSDIYSLGVVLYQMVSGRLPFESESPMGMVMQHINDAPPPLTQFVPSLLPSLDGVINKALAKDPEARFATAGEMAAALRQIIGMEALASSPTVSPPPPVGKSDFSTATPVTPLVQPVTPAWVSGGDEDEEEEEERLLRTWPVGGDKKPAVKTPTLFPSAQPGIEVPPEKQKRPRRRSVLSRLTRAFATLLLMAIVGGVAWLGIRGDIPAAVQRLLALTVAVQRPTATLPTEEVPLMAATSPLEGTATATPSVPATATSQATTGTPTPSATPILPTVTGPAVAGTCQPRVKLNQVRLEAGEFVAPGAAFSAYVSLRNTGACAWPQGTKLAFVSGEPQGTLNAISLQPLAAGETTQVIVPLQAPSEVGVYTSTWRVLENVIPIRVEVRIPPTPTPTPRGQRATATPLPTPTPTLPPLVLAAPTLSLWSEDVASGIWRGTFVLQADGGTGNYRYYLQAVREDTLLPDGQLTIEGRRCQNVPVTIMVVSGQQVARWEGWIAYPAAEKCR